MATGYTCKINNGEVTEFKDFAIMCARAFGACISMRDDPMDTPIPDEFPLSTYHTEALVEAKQAKAKFIKKNKKKKETMYKKSLKENEQYLKNNIVESLIINRRYNHILEKAQLYIPPTEDHVNFKEFMISQLTESIKHDCDINYYLNELEKPKITYDQWYVEKMKMFNWNIEYHNKEDIKEHEKATERTKWIRDLKKSVENI